VQAALPVPHGFAIGSALPGQICSAFALFGRALGGRESRGKSGSPTARPLKDSRDRRADYGNISGAQPSPNIVAAIRAVCRGRPDGKGRGTTAENRFRRAQSAAGPAGQVRRVGTNSSISLNCKTRQPTSGPVDIGIPPIRDRRDCRTRLRSRAGPEPGPLHRPARQETDPLLSRRSGTGAVYACSTRPPPAQSLASEPAVPTSTILPNLQQALALIRAAAAGPGITMKPVMADRDCIAVHPPDMGGRVTSLDSRWRPFRLTSQPGPSRLDDERIGNQRHSQHSENVLARGETSTVVLLSVASSFPQSSAVRRPALTCAFAWVRVAVIRGSRG